MTIIEIKGNLFEETDCYYAHCISSDFALGKGIAVDFQNKYNLKNKLHTFCKEKGIKSFYPNCILIDNVFNLVTKKFYWDKPTYKNVESSLYMMKDYCLSLNIKTIAMPRIASGLDRLLWERVKNIIIDVFKDTDIKIIIKYI